MVKTKEDRRRQSANLGSPHSTVSRDVTTQSGCLVTLLICRCKNKLITVLKHKYLNLSLSLNALMVRRNNFFYIIDLLEKEIPYYDT